MASERSVGGRFHALTAWAGFALAGLLLAVATLAGAAAQAQDITLVSNLGQTASTGVGSFQAQPFTTGSNVNGYVLTSVKVRRGEGVGDVGIRIVPSQTDGTPDLSNPDNFIVLTGPATFPAGTPGTVTAPANATLDADTAYHVLATGASDINEPPNLPSRTTSNAEDSGGAAGWSIGNVRYWRNTPTASWNSSTAYLLFIEITGSVVTTTTLSTDATLSGLALADADGNAVALNETLASTTTSYTADVGNAVGEITVTPTVNHSGKCSATSLLRWS